SNRTVTRSREKAHRRKALSGAGNRYGTGVWGNHRAQQGLANRHGECGESGGGGGYRAAAGRNGNRKGTSGAGGPPDDPARREQFHQVELRGDSVGVAGERVIRT